MRSAFLLLLAGALYLGCSDDGGPGTDLGVPDLPGQKPDAGAPDLNKQPDLSGKPEAGAPDLNKQLDLPGKPDAGAPDLNMPPDLPGPKPDAGPSDGLASKCPPDLLAQGGKSCKVAQSATCKGLVYATTCSGSSTGSLLCKCYLGSWICMNWSCPSYCPKSLKEALKGPACKLSLAEQVIQTGACYYGPPSVLCFCGGGKIYCNNPPPQDAGP